MIKLTEAIKIKEYIEAYGGPVYIEKFDEDRYVKVKIIDNPITVRNLYDHYEFQNSPCKIHTTANLDLVELFKQQMFGNGYLKRLQNIKIVTSDFDKLLEIYREKISHIIEYREHAKELLYIENLISNLEGLVAIPILEKHISKNHKNFDKNVLNMIKNYLGDNNYNLYKNKNNEITKVYFSPINEESVKITSNKLLLFFNKEEIDKIRENIDQKNENSIYLKVSENSKYSEHLESIKNKRFIEIKMNLKGTFKYNSDTVDPLFELDKSISEFTENEIEEIRKLGYTFRRE